MDIKKFDKVEVIDENSVYHYWIGIVVSVDSNRRIYTVGFPSGRYSKFDENSIRIYGKDMERGLNGRWG